MSVDLYPLILARSRRHGIPSVAGVFWLTGVFAVLFCCLASPVCGVELVALQQYVRTVEFSGWTRPATLMNLAAETSGKCSSVLVDVGDTVPGDGVVAKLDDTFVALDLAKNRISQERAQRQLDEEKKNLQRYTELINQKSTPQVTYDQAALQADLYGYSRQLLKVEETSLQELLARHAITGPPGWLVTDRLIQPGEYVRQGEPVFKVGDFRALLVDFLLTPKELTTLEGMEEIKLYFPEVGSTAEAEHYRTSPLYDTVSKKIEVELRVDTGRFPGLRAGLQARLSVAGEAVFGQFVVPSSALINRYEAHWLQSPDGENRKVVLLGFIAGGDPAIISGDGLVTGQKFVRNPIAAADRK